MSKLKSDVLLLNASFEPLNLITVERAITLLVKDKIIVEEYSDGFLHSQRQKFQIPSVVRKKEYINIRKRIAESGLKRKKIYIRDSFRCQYCLKRQREDKLTLDHIIPKGQGGLNTVVNLVTSCFPCNQKKGNRTPEQANMKLHKTEKELNVRLDRIMSHHYVESKPNWGKYFFLSDEANRAHYE